MRRGERVGSGSNADLVLLNGGLETLEALGVLIVGPDKDVLLAGGHGERPNAGHDVAHDLARLEDVDEPAVLRLELAVPVDLGVVELEGAVALGDLDVQVVGAGQDFVLERPELGVGADIVDLVDDGLDLGVLIEQDLGYEVLVGEIVITKVEMRWVPSVVISHVTTRGSGKGGAERERRTYMARDIEAGGDLVVEIFGENGTHHIACNSQIRLRKRAAWTVPYGSSSSRNQGGVHRGRRSGPSSQRPP